MLTCPACGTANGPTAKFCAECGAKLAAVPVVREERRTVTVLFADLAGFTSRAETMDPEDVRAFLHPWYDLLEREVVGHGGTVERHLGDGILALFGAPVAHEDDHERAVRAALRILERLPGLDLDLHARLGINTGEVLFAALGPGREDAVTGDAVNTAARLQAAAPVDTVVVGDATHEATARLFLWEALPPIEAKGKAEPVPAWRPLEPISRASGELLEETTPFVGRDHELQTLARAFERSRSTPSLEVVTVVAQPGLGKSRLVRELARYVDALPELVTWRVGRCLPYGEGIGFWALSEIVAAQAGILETDDQITLSAKLDAAITEPDPSLRLWLTQRLAPLVGLETNAAPPQTEEAYTAWRRFLESIAATGPLVLIVEDLHWADEGFVAFLQHFVAHTAGMPIALVVTARPELEERHPSWLTRARRSTVLPLDALPDRDLSALVGTTLPAASPELISTVVERAAGSPLYAEQLAAMLRDRSRDELDLETIPPTLTSLLASRIDALPPTVKPALLDASVVGKVFWTGAVATLGERSAVEVEPALDELTRRELVRPRFPSSMEGEPEFTFWHALLRDVAYGELPRAARLAKHRAAAAWIAGRSGGARGRTAELVAAHLERALELAQTTRATDELSVLHDLLADALLGAADHALATRPDAAPGFARRALELLGPDDPRRVDALVALGRAQLAAFEFAAAADALNDAHALLRARGEDLAAARLAPLRAPALRNAGAAEGAATALADARMALAGDPGGDLAGVIAEQAHAAMVTGDDDQGAALAAEAVELADAHGLPAPYWALLARGVIRYGAEPDAAEADLLAAIREAEAAGDLYAAANILMNRLTPLAEHLGVAAGLAAADEAAAFLDARGLPSARLDGFRAEILLEAGRWDEAAEIYERVRVWAAAHGDVWQEFHGTWGLAVVALGRGESTGPLDELAALGRASGVPPSLYGPCVAEAALARGDQLEAARAVEKTLDASMAGRLLNLPDLVRAALRAGAPALALRACQLGALAGPLCAAESQFAAAQLDEAEGRLVDASRAYEEALRVFRTVGHAVDEAETLICLGRCQLSQGKTLDGVARLRDARELWVGMGASTRIAEVDVLLAAAGAQP